MVIVTVRQDDRSWGPPAKYQLNEMPPDSYPKQTEQNVMDSDGTLIISHGPLTGGSDYTRKMAQKHGKLWMHIDASRTSNDAVFQLVRAWINGSQIKILNVAGPRASKDPRIYVTTKGLLTVLIKMMSLGSQERQTPSE